MNSRLIVFNVFYYFITLTFLYQGYSDPSSSLGYGFYIFGFWIISGIFLTILVLRNKIPTSRTADKVGLFLATPIMFLIIIGTGLSTTDQAQSEWYPYKDGYRYKIVTYVYRGSLVRKRREIYRSQEKVDEFTSGTTITWLKDSTWIHFSEDGDTLKIERYRNDKRLE